MRIIPHPHRGLTHLLQLNPLSLQPFAQQGDIPRREPVLPIVHMGRFGQLHQGLWVGNSVERPVLRVQTACKILYSIPNS